MRKVLSALATIAIMATQPAWSANPMVEMKTNQGTITIELYPDKAPKTVDNFVQYVRDGFYNGTLFHRVMNGFMIQGGGFEAGMKEKATRPPIENEAKNGLRNEVGTLAMARTSAPHSASAQFFINLVNNNRLDYPSFDGWGYAVFGRVVNGMDVVKKIATVPTGNAAGHQNVPVTPVIIESAKLLPESK
jgi:cyclophilin family peptidyl-prolyl cis-trans isomerase